MRHVACGLCKSFAPQPRVETIEDFPSPRPEEQQIRTTPVEYVLIAALFLLAMVVGVLIVTGKPPGTDISAKATSSKRPQFLAIWGIQV